MKKRKLKKISDYFDRLPLVTSSILFDSLAQALSAHLYELYRDTVVFTHSEDRAITHVSCDIARLFVLLRLMLDCADSEQEIRVHLSLDEDRAARLSISMQGARELPRSELRSIAMLGHLRLYENDDGVSIWMETRHEQVLHLFAIDAVTLSQIVKRVSLMIDEFYKENQD